MKTYHATLRRSGALVSRAVTLILLLLLPACDFLGDDTPSSLGVNVYPKGIRARYRVGPKLFLNYEILPNFRGGDLFRRPDGRYLVTGAPENAVALWLYESTGEFIWKKTFSVHCDSDRRGCDSFATERGFVLSGLDSTGARRLAWTDLDGNEIRATRLSESTPGRPLKHIPTSDGGDVFMFNGSSFSVVKFSEAGQEEWVRTFTDGAISDLAARQDGGFLAVGEVKKGPFPGQGIEEVAWLVGLDAQGLIEWTKEIGPPDRSFQHVVALNDGHFLVAGRSSVDHSRGDWCILADAEGTLVWNSDEKPENELRDLCSLSRTYVLGIADLSYVQGSAEAFEIVTSWDETTTIRVGVGGRLLRRYDWPFSLDRDGASCGINQFIKNPQDELALLAHCIDLTSSTSGFNTGVLWTEIVVLE